MRGVGGGTGHYEGGRVYDKGEGGRGFGKGKGRQQNKYGSNKELIDQTNSPVCRSGWNIRAR